MAISKFGFDVSEEKAKSFLEKAYSWKVPEIIYPDDTHEKWWSTLYKRLNAFYIDNGIDNKLFSKINECFREILTDVGNYELYDDTIETLELAAKKGYKHYIVTNNYPEITENIAKLGLSDFFSGYIVSAHIGYEKPKIEFFKKALEVAQNPDVFYMIGDNPIADIMGAKKAGFSTIMVHNGKTSEFADCYFDELKPIIDYIDGGTK